jgi:NAD(P)-dependent dehydrogenase (short-subunit alcohol dehydrogenase family)
MKLSGKVAIVTGGARGIGEGIARCLAEEGASVAIIDLDGEQAEKTAATLATPSIGFAADAADESDMEAAVARVVERFGGLDILVNNAGAGRGPVQPTQQDYERYGRSFRTLDQQGWDEQMAQNLRTTFVCSKAAVGYLEQRPGSSIVNIASIAGLSAAPTLPAYAAAKAGVISFTRSLALDLAPKDVRVNAICPGFLWTRAWEGLATALKMTVPAMAELEPREVFLQVVKNGVPMGREQTPEDIGKLAAFLCSDDARNITGQAISVDGGITLR